jgi:hypothetical protein
MLFFRPATGEVWLNNLDNNKTASQLTIVPLVNSRKKKMR